MGLVKRVIKIILIIHIAYYYFWGLTLGFGKWHCIGTGFYDSSRQPVKTTRALVFRPFSNKFFWHYFDFAVPVYEDVPRFSPDPRDLK